VQTADLVRPDFSETSKVGRGKKEAQTRFEFRNTKEATAAVSEATANGGTGEKESTTTTRGKVTLGKKGTLLGRKKRNGRKDA